MTDQACLEDVAQATAPPRARGRARVRDAVRRILASPRGSARRLPPAFGRALDLLVATLALIAFGPAMLIITLLILMERSGPVLFRHERLGRNGDTFNVIKFRTMHIDGNAILKRHLAADPAAAAEWLRDHKLRDDPRVSRLGSFLRKASLDELPQVFNVLAGEMSIVGPRPIVQAEVARYGKYYRHYCSVRPGITGIWQVSGRNDVTYRRRVLMDALYSRRKSVNLDIRIMLATLPAVVLRKGSY